MRVRLLGPIEVDIDGHSVAFSAAKDRSLLAALALAAGSDATTDSLISALWGEDPPNAARKTLQTYIWNLRQALGNDAVETTPVGYRLPVDHAEVDALEFRRLVRSGDDALRRGQVESGRLHLASALALWRGEALAGVARHTALAGEAARLEQERLGALETRIAADLTAGHHHDLVGELESLVGEHPFRERFWVHLMIALYRNGRQADALAAYQRVRHQLGEELGLEPGGELKRTEAAILGHDLDTPSPVELVTGALDESIRPTPVRYATASDGVSVAFRSAGRGPVEILSIPGYIHHLDIWWNAPTNALVRSLTEMGRLTVFDKRGMGLSDRPETIDVDGWTSDALAVLDAAGIERAVILGVSGGALTALRLAALHPERVSALVIFGGFARHLAADDYPEGHRRDVVESYAQNLEAKWGTGVGISSAAPSLAHDPAVRAYWARYQALSASPSAAMRFLWATAEPDLRHLLPLIHVPTLVAHAERDLLVPVEQGRYIADHIDSAEFVSFDSDVHLICVSDVLDQLAAAIDDFVGSVVDRCATSDENERKIPIATTT